MVVISIDQRIAFLSSCNTMPVQICLHRPKTWNMLIRSLEIVMEQHPSRNQPRQYEMGVGHDHNFLVEDNEERKEEDEAAKGGW